MRFQETGFEGLWLIEPVVYGDSRGHFLELFRSEIFDSRRSGTRFVQDNFSRSAKGVLRGLHYQAGQAAQQKLISVVSGEILDVAVDLRKDSGTFGRSYAVRLDSHEHRMLWIPEGFAHGFSVLSAEAGVHYKCSNYYNPDMERGVRWNDPELGIDWQVDEPIVSEKDSGLPWFSELNENDLF